MNPPETRNEFVLNVLQLVSGTLITLICIACGFILFRQHVEGGAYFLGLVSGTPAAALTYQLGKAAGEKKGNAPQPVSVTATAQAGDTPDTSSISVSATSAPDDKDTPST